MVRVIVAILDSFHYTLNEEGEKTSHEGIREKLIRHVLPRLQRCVDGRVCDLCLARWFREVPTCIRRPRRPAHRSTQMRMRILQERQWLSQWRSC